ncbi:hypothetical protein DNH61_25100 [Paenibacillus sambharensis]|uniref:Sugar ABC transporter substrate-binding protein n=1 Tax=Paenibacillus sambharensis TaxID=1803190 RepID=A0A2W1LDB8_9BACL|nr:extracellular solute-binding protein [Paenibacillus sambharensis]PZD93062.1 hypothetical protein DNH61_25100 [Paenibacillus sambharensis]
MKGRFTKRAAAGAAIVIILLMLQACAAPPEPEELEGTLRIAVNSEDGFNYSSGNALAIHFPNVKIETVTRPESVQTVADYIDWLKGTSADMYMINHEYFYYKLVNEGVLKPLDPLLKKNKHDTGSYALGSIDYLRAMGDGQLYALPVGFETEALFINQSLFRSEGIPMPETPLTWHELLSLASSFPGEQRGYDTWSTPGQLLLQISEQDNLAIWDGKQMTVNTEGWMKLLTDYEGLLGEEADYLELTDKDNFIAGDAAMAWAKPSYALRLHDKKLDFEWEMMAPPAGAGGASDLRFTGLIGIGSDSDKDSLAWRVMEYMAGKEAAVPSLDILPLTDVPSAVSGVTVQPLYEQRFGTFRAPKEPVELDESLPPMAAEHLTAFFQGRYTAEETLQRIESEGNALIAAYPN